MSTQYDKLHPEEHMANNAEIVRIMREIVEMAWEDRQVFWWFFMSAALLGARIGAWITKKRYGA
jgi:glycerol uptake facilitator-like aquaporin